MPIVTLREKLAEAEFDWDNGVLLYQHTESVDPGWASQCDKPIVIDSEHPILDKSFYDGYGGPEMPRFFARDRKAIYFPTQYDGQTWVTRIVIDPKVYLAGADTPYPGG